MYKTTDKHTKQAQTNENANSNKRKQQATNIIKRGETSKTRPKMKHTR